MTNKPNDPQNPNRMDETGIMKRAGIDLSKAPSCARFQTMTKMKKANHADKHKGNKMTNKPEMTKLIEDKEIASTAAGGESSLSIPEISGMLEFCINGARPFFDEIRAAQKANLTKAETPIASISDVPHQGMSGMLEFCVNGATWLKMNRYRSEDIEEEQNQDPVKPTEG